MRPLVRLSGCPWAPRTLRHLEYFHWLSFLRLNNLHGPTRLRQAKISPRVSGSFSSVRHWKLETPQKTLIVVLSIYL